MCTAHTFWPRRDVEIAAREHGDRWRWTVFSERGDWTFSHACITCGLLVTVKPSKIGARVPARYSDLVKLTASERKALEARPLAYDVTKYRQEIGEAVLTFDRARPDYPWCTWTRQHGFHWYRTKVEAREALSRKGVAA